MATTSISSITSSSAKYQIVGLGSAFTTAAYQRAGIASSQVATDGSTTAPSGVIAYMAAPASGTSTSTPISAAVTGAFTGGKTYTVYGYVLTKAGQYYRCGSATFTTLIDKPSKPVLGTAYTDALYMTWGSVGGATKYTIRWRIGTGTYSSYTTTNTNTYYTIPNLTANTTYSVSVCAIGANLTSSYSDENTNCKTLTPPVPSVPGQPVISSRTSSSLSLSWTASTGSPTSYTLTYRPTGATDWSYQTGIASNSTVLSGLTGGETYDLAVCALNTSGSSTYSTPTVTGTTNPSLSTNPTIGTRTATSIQAKSVTVGVYTAIEITCEYQDWIGTWYAQETRAAASDSYTTFSGLSSGVSYRFRSRTRVDTSGGSLYSSYSSYVTTTTLTSLPTPTISSTVKDQNSIGITMNAYDASYGTVTYYSELWNQAGTTLINSLSGTSRTHTYTGLTANITYMIKIKASSTLYSMSSYGTYYASTWLYLWEWSTTVAAGVDFKITPSNWLDFIQRIDDTRSAYGLGVYGFTRTISYFQTGNIFYAWMFTQAANAIDEIPNITVAAALKTVASGDNMYASQFAALRTALNTAITNL